MAQKSTKGQRITLNNLRSITKNILHDGSEVIFDLLPEEAKKVYLKSKVPRLERSREVARFPGLDEEIQPDKWYYRFFDRDDTITVLRMGWFYQHIGTEWIKVKFNKANLDRQVRLIKGEIVIRKGYRVRSYILIDDRKYYMKSKVISPRSISLASASKSFKKRVKKSTQVDGSTKEGEEIFFSKLFEMVKDQYTPQFDPSAIRASKYRQNLQLKKTKKNGRKK